MMKEGPHNLKDHATEFLSTEPASADNKESEIKTLFEAHKKQEEETKQAHRNTNLSRIQIARSRKKVYAHSRNLKSIKNFFFTALFLSSLSMFALPHTLLGILGASIAGSLGALAIHFAPNIQLLSIFADEFKRLCKSSN
jgi:hypothetical protein